MTRRQKELCTLAQGAGYSIFEKNGRIEIIKTVGRRHAIKGIVIYGDGTAFDLAVALSVAKGMRSYNDMRAVLGLPPAKSPRPDSCHATTSARPA